MRRMTVLFLSLLALVAFHSSALVPPVIVHPDAEDLDNDLVVDRLAAEVSGLLAAGRPGDLVRLEVVLYEPYTTADLELFRFLGGVLIHTFEAVSYGYSGALPARRLDDLRRALASSGRLCVLAADPPGHATLDVSAQLARVRPQVWDAGYTGSSSTTIAVLDTGIDDSHPDFAGRVSAGWTDTTADGYTSKVDYNGHGSHVAGIALGSGASYGVGTDPMYVVTTQSGYLPTGSNSGFFDVVEVKNTGGNQLQVLLWWAGGGTTQVSARDTGWSWMGYNNSSSSPNTLNYTITTTGVYRPYFGNVSGAGGVAYAGGVAASYEPVGDGHNLFTGMAPGATLLGVKVLSNDGSGWATDWGEGLDWCVTNRDLYHIRVVNMSLALYNGGTDATLDAKVNTAVANGIVVVCAAGNDFPSYTVGSPGNAAKALTVGAVNDLGVMTNYSSNGFGGQGKPDVVAPGGSMVAGTRITSVETNDGDAFNTQSDHTPDNYANIHGTSMASPVVAGVAALVIDAQEQSGDPWSSTEAEALRVKSLILATATETNQAGEMSWNGGGLPTTPSGNDPTLDRGAADLVEGFGKVNGDAAVEALTNEYTLAVADSFSLGSGAFDRKARAYWVTLDASQVYDLELTVPAGADCDLFVYGDTPDANGRPVLVASSTTAGLGVDEQVAGWAPPSSGVYRVVVKLVSGSGTVTFQAFLSAGLIFRDGFESGDTTAWSSAVP